jgi:O-antigen chain-terminating methyltransferase
MPHRNAPEATVAAMKATIRQHLAHRRAGPPLARPDRTAPDRPPLPDNFRGLRPHIDWHQILAGVRLAEQHVPVGSHLPELTRLPGPLRWVGLLVARCVVVLTRFITTRQRDFNAAAIGTLHNVHGMLRHLEQVQTENLKRLEALSAQQNASLGELTGRIERLQEELARNRQGLNAQDQRLSLLLGEVRRRLAGPLDTEQMQALAAEEAHSLDALRAALQELSHGSRAGMQECRRDYLAVLHTAGAGTAERPILDVGSGSGAWLELLREEGLEARGVEGNRVLAEECRGRGLRVGDGEPLGALRGEPDASLGAVTAFGLLERLPLSELVRFLDDVVRVLRPGGVAVFETPNPQNLLVGSYAFHLDPTRHRPLAAPVARFLAEARGLCHVEIRYPFAPAETPAGRPADALADALAQPQTYAVVGWKV